MKKNLISAVAAGLALALAFTSFGCESGSNDPVGVTADTAYAEGKTFTYQAKPTEYTYGGISTTGVTVNDEGSQTITNWGTIVTRYIAGVNSYNRKSGAVKALIEEKAYYQAPALGDVCNTKTQKIVLDAAKQTFTWTEETTEYQVVGIREYSFTTQGDQLSYITLPFYFYNYGGIIPTGYVAYTGATAGYINTYTGTATPAMTFDEQWAYAEARIPADQKLNALAGIAGTNSINNLLVKDVADAYKRGARFAIVAAKNGKGTIAYYKKLEGSFIQDDTNLNFVKKADYTGVAPAAKGNGKYKLTGDYQNGTIKITTWGNEVYRDDGYYYVDNVLQLKLADTVHPDATAYTSTTPHAADKLYSKWRTLSIAGGVITAPRFFDSTYGGARESKNGFFLDSSFVKYADAVWDADWNGRTTSRRDGTNDKKTCYSYSIVKND